MSLKTHDLWTLTRKRPQIDPHDLAEAVRAEVHRPELDYRERLLVRDSVEALRLYWGDQRFDAWLTACPERDKIEAIRREEFEEIGYPSLRSRIMAKTDPDDIRAFFTHLGKKLRHDTRIEVAGVVALILSGLVSRNTEDIDVVDEVPKDIREDHALVDAMQKSYGLHLGHVQSHYLPTGWRERIHYFDTYDRLQVSLADAYDVALSKLFSTRTKDLEDLRVLKPQFDKSVLVDRLSKNGKELLAVPGNLQKATDNWNILYGEALPL